MGSGVVGEVGESPNRKECVHVKRYLEGRDGKLIMGRKFSVVKFPGLV